jgi:hypothetical protein
MKGSIENIDDILEYIKQNLTLRKEEKDKYGEVELTLFLLNTFFDNQLQNLEHYNSKTDTISLYIAKRTEFLMKKLPKLHEDYYVEFEREVTIDVRTGARIA